MYNMCSDQYLLGAGGAIGLNFLAVERIALYAGVPEDEILDFWERVRFITSVVLSEQHKDAESKRKKK